MKKRWIFLFVFAFTVQGCSQGTRGDLKELGNDVKRDVNKTARNIDDKVQDAVE